MATPTQHLTASSSDGKTKLFLVSNHKKRERERERDALCKLRQAKNRSLSTYWASRAVPFIFLAHLSGLDGTGGWMESENHRLYSLVVAVVVNAAAAAAAARGRRPYLKIIRQWRRFSFIPLSPFRSYSAASSSQSLFFDKGERIIWRLTATVSL